MDWYVSFYLSLCSVAWFHVIEDNKEMKRVVEQESEEKKRNKWGGIGKTRIKLWDFYKLKKDRLSMSKSLMDNNQEISNQLFMEKQ